MQDRILENIITIVRNAMVIENMTVGTGGFSGSAAPEGPVAGYDPVIDGRSRIARRLPPVYKKILSKNKNKKV